MTSPSPSSFKKISILGATGSVGSQTCKLVEAYPHCFEVEVLTAQKDIEKLAEWAQKLRSKRVVIADEALYLPLKKLLDHTSIHVSAGKEALLEAASCKVDVVVAAIMGMAGLAPTLCAIAHSTQVALANKECLVSAGLLFMQEVKKRNTLLIPVDSEHNAIFQAMQGNNWDDVEKLVLTASGGPFFTWPKGDMQEITPAQAVKHPKWSMGKKISVDSATMMNKGLEYIEAAYLFPVDSSSIEIIVHPEHIIHSMVHFKDGSVLAQLAMPDMAVPLSYALGWPLRLHHKSPRICWNEIGSFTFQEPDFDKFPALNLARDALKRGAFGPTILNAANEVAVHAFLDHKIKFLDITQLVEDALEEYQRKGDPFSFDDVFDCDKEVRIYCEEKIASNYTR